MNMKIWKKLLFTIFIYILIQNLPVIGKLQPDITCTELKNGLTIITKEVKSSPLVSINIYIRVGSKDEKKGTEGLTHFCEHLFFRGTRSTTGTEFKSALESLGGVCNAETTKDYTRYYLNIPAKYAMKGLKLLVDALQNASFNEEEIEQERKVIIEEYRMTSENLMNILNDQICEMAFLEHPYGKPIIGKEKNLKNFTRQDFINFRERHYSPEKLVFVIVGNFEKEKAIQYITESFRSVPPGISQDPVIPQEKQLTEIREKIIYKGYDETFVIIGFHGPSVKDRKHVYATDLLCFMLGMGNSSIFNRELVIQKELVKEISVNFLTQKDPGIIIIDAVIKNKDADMVKKEIINVLKKVILGEFDEEELTRARNFLINSYIFGNETNAGEASSLGYYESIDSYEFAKTYVENIKKVKKEEIIETAKKYFTGAYCCLIVKPDPKMKKQDEEDE